MQPIFLVVPPYCRSWNIYEMSAEVIYGGFLHPVFLPVMAESLVGFLYWGLTTTEILISHFLEFENFKLSLLVARQVFMSTDIKATLKLTIWLNCLRFGLNWILYFWIWNVLPWASRCLISRLIIRQTFRVSRCIWTLIVLVGPKQFEPY